MTISVSRPLARFVRRACILAFAGAIAATAATAEPAATGTAPILDIAAFWTVQPHDSALLIGDPGSPGQGGNATGEAKVALQSAGGRVTGR